MIYLGILIMVYSIYKYMRFARKIKGLDNWKKEQRILNIPIVLLLLFLLGYIVLAFFGNPDIVVSLILFGGSIFVWVMQMLMEHATDRIREHEQMEARAKAAESANEAKSYFLSNMSHDIRTPLNAIIGYTTLAKTSTLEEQAKFISKIDNAGKQMLELVNEVLEMSRIDSGKYELEPINANLSHIVDRCFEVLHMQMENKHIDFKVSCEMDNPWVECDGHRLERVLMNMLGNAYKFTNEGGSVSLTLRQTATHDGIGEYEFRVKDTGIGMSKEFAEKVFVPFERERTSTVSGIQGTGLGMAISNSIIQLMGGNIEVFSEQGKGTEFRIHLSFPLGHEEEEAKEEKTDTRDFNGRRVLLVEDNPINREIATMILGQAGFAVESAENGQIAVEKARASKPGDYDVILMDIQMPVMDGYTAAREIRCLGNRSLANIPIIAMTANAFKEDVDTARESGMQAHVAKPINVDALMQTLSTVLQQSSEKKRA